MDFQVAGCTVSGTSSDLARFSLISKKAFDTFHVEAFFTSVVKTDFLQDIPEAISGLVTENLLRPDRQCDKNLIVIFTELSDKKLCFFSRISRTRRCMRSYFYCFVKKSAACSCVLITTIPTP